MANLDNPLYRSLNEHGQRSHQSPSVDINQITRDFASILNDANKNEAVCVTRLPPLRFQAQGPADVGDASPSTPSTSRLRSPFRAVCGAAAIAALVAGSVFPLLIRPVSEPASASAVIGHNQGLTVDNVASDFGVASIESLEAVEVAPTNTSNEPGLFDASTLSKSDVRYPFDAEVPLTDPFGYRTAPVEQFHDGQDFAAPGGTSIRAIASGVVTEAGFASDGCGFGVKLQHNVDGQTLTSRYCHMEENSHNYAVGDKVSIGDEAGRVGNTGMSFGAHLHLALRLNGEPIDPVPFLKEKAGR